MASLNRKNSKNIVTVSEALNNVQKGTVKISNVTFVKNLVRNSGSAQHPQQHRLSFAQLRHI